MPESVTPTKKLTIKSVPSHIQKLQDLKQKIMNEEAEALKKEIQDQPIPAYKKDFVVTAFNWMYEKFPKCFTKREQKPLKINILNDLFEKREIEEETDQKPSKRGIRTALSTYVRNRYYLKACIINAPRIDLDGLEVSEVTESEAAYAIETYNKFHTVFKEKKKKEKQIERDKKQRERRSQIKTPCVDKK